MWTGRLYLGSQSQPMDVIFDNGSDWLTIQSKECQNCQGNRFDPERSSTGKRISEQESLRVYGQAQMRGYEFTD